jgi:Na+-translocating ferredoxin:NAD+ oxidoreductase RnfD subunit
LLVVAGVFITDRVNKIPAVLAFLGVYYVCFTAVAFAGRAPHVAEIFRAPDLHAALYFAFFILTDPPTSPTRHPDQLVYGAVAGIVAWGTFMTVGAAFYLLAGVLVANGWEAMRRWRVRRARALTRRHAVAV